MPPWERYNPNATPAPAQAPAPAAGPWSKFQQPAAVPAPADPNEGWGPPGMIVPVQFKEGTGEPRLAMPQALTDIGNALSSVTKAATGQYGMEIDPATGRPTTITNEMIGDAMGGASLGLTPLNPAAAVGAQFGRQVIGAPARRVIQRELGNAGIEPSQVGPRLAQIGPDAMIADLSPGLQARAAAIATMPGSGQASIVDALSARRAGSNARIMADVDDTLGPAPVPSRLTAEIEQNQASLSPLYQEALRHAAQVNTGDLADSLDTMAGMLRGDAQRSIQRVRAMLNATDNPNLLDPNPATLLQTRHAIDGLLAGEADPNVLRALGGARRQIDDLLADAVPGIKDIDAQYAELARQNTALGTGQQVLETGRTAMRPEELDELIRTGALPQGAQIGPSAVPLRLREGARAEIDRIIGTNVRDINAMKRIVAGDGNWNRERLVSVFGQERADSLLAILEREALFNATEQLGLAGSRTQVLKAAQDDIVGGAPRANPIKSAANLKFGDAVSDLAERSLSWVSKGKRASRNQEIADALMATGDSPAIGAISQRPSGMTERAWLDLVRAFAQQPDYIGGQILKPTVVDPMNAVVQALLGPRR